MQVDFHKAFITLSLFLLSSICFSQKKIEKFKFNGTRFYQINDTLFAAETEVSNKDYKDFLHDIPKKEYLKLKNVYSLWNTRFSFDYNTPMAQHYGTHPAFDDYPAVNMSHEAAERFCEWLTEKHNKKLIHKDGLEFRLPSEKEWVLLSNSNPETNFPHSINNGKTIDGNCYMVNIKAYKNDTVSYGADGGLYMVKKNAYWPNHFGLFNLIGNVAEMTSEEGVQKGGSWYDELEDCKVNKNQNYPEPDPRVGFRVVAVISKK